MKKIYLDVDGVITNTVKKFCEIYNEEYKNYPSFIPADWTKVRAWNFTDQCPLIETPKKIEDYFDKPEMYYEAEFIPNAIEVIERLSNKYIIGLITMGSQINLANKYESLRKQIPFSCFYGIDIKKHKDKRSIDMTDGIFIDDVATNLKNSNAKTKICFGDIMPWNEEWQGKRCQDWGSLSNLLL